MTTEEKLRLAFKSGNGIVGLETGRYPSLEILALQERVIKGELTFEQAIKIVVSEATSLAKCQAETLAGAIWLNANEQLRELERDGEIFSIRHSGKDLFPEYAVAYSPAVKKVIAHLAKKDGWGVAFWFQSVNSYLGGRRPIDVLQRNQDAVVAAAADEAMGIAHA